MSKFVNFFFKFKINEGSYHRYFNCKTWMQLLILMNINIILIILVYFQKMEVGLSNHQPVCRACVCLCVPQ
jgi:hypothetical protein